MNIELRSLYTRFNEALRWNGFLVISTKINKTILSFILYSKLPAKDFSAWANCYSIVFILLLWLDFGFSRSIPRFSVLFLKNIKVKSNFLFSIMSFRFFIALLASGIIVAFSSAILSFLHLEGYDRLLYATLVLFLAETLKSILQCIYHSYFWNKEFNTIETITLFLGTSAISITTLIFSLPSTTLIYISVLLHVATSLLLIGWSLYRLNTLLFAEQKESHISQGNQAEPLLEPFLIHSSSMWGLLVIQSLTERNVLVPFITLVGGHEASSIFKIANDGALFFQRCIIKTLGVSATSFLARIEESKHQHTEEAFNNGMNFVVKRTISLVIPMMIGIGVCSLGHNALTQWIVPIAHSSTLFPIFLILAYLYLAQTLFFAYDQCLEVKRDYAMLFLSKLPYALLIGLYLFFIKVPHLFLLSFFLIAVHSIRILSTFMRVVYIQRNYRFSFPWAYSLRVLAISVLTSVPFIILLIFA